MACSYVSDAKHVPWTYKYRTWSLNLKENVRRQFSRKSFRNKCALFNDYDGYLEDILAILHKLWIRLLHFDFRLPYFVCKYV